MTRGTHRAAGRRGLEAWRATSNPTRTVAADEVRDVAEQVFRKASRHATPIISCHS